MKLYTLEREQVIDRPLEQVFAFFAKPENLARMRDGTVIDYTIKILGFKVHWRTLIGSYDPPYGFADEQLRGPYSYWHHRHHFEKTESGTRIYDHVTYALPFGFLGRLAHFVLVKRQLQHIFNYRSGVIREIFAQ